MRILVVEDDPVLGDGLRVGLTQEGHTVDWFDDGTLADGAISSGSYDLIVLDLDLPGVSGWHLLKRMRAAAVDAPTLVLTARDAPADRVAALDAGADDYVCKPFHFGEFCARLRALHRRSVGQLDDTTQVGPIRLSNAARTLHVDGQLVELTKREFTILQLLLQSAGRVVTRGQIESAIYGWDDGVASNSVDVHIHNLRKKIGLDLIRTVRGVGYIVSNAANDTR